MRFLAALGAAFVPLGAASLALLAHVGIARSNHDGTADVLYGWEAVQYGWPFVVGPLLMLLLAVAIAARAVHRD